jgi:hypothetical protein
VVGEYLADEHTMTIAPAAPEGRYRLAVGLYDPMTGARQMTADGEDHVLLDETIVLRDR